MSGIGCYDECSVLTVILSQCLKWVRNGPVERERSRRDDWKYAHLHLIILRFSAPCKWDGETASNPSTPFDSTPLTLMFHDSLQLGPSSRDTGPSPRRRSSNGSANLHASTDLPPPDLKTRCRANPLARRAPWRLHTSHEASLCQIAVERREDPETAQKWFQDAQCGGMRRDC